MKHSLATGTLLVNEEGAVPKLAKSGCRGNDGFWNDTSISEYNGICLYGRYFSYVQTIAKVE